MKKLFLILTLIISPFFASCGGATACGFVLSQAFNSQQNFWACSGLGVIGGFAIFSDGTGEAIGATTGFPILDVFTWQESGCAEIMTTGFNIALQQGFTAEEINLDGSIASGNLSFTHVEDSVSTDVNCVVEAR